MISKIEPKINPEDILPMNLNDLQIGNMIGCRGTKPFGLVIINDMDMEQAEALKQQILNDQMLNDLIKQQIIFQKEIGNNYENSALVKILQNLLNESQRNVNP